MKKFELTEFHHIVGHLPDFKLVAERVALLIIDLHYLQAHRDYGFGKKAKKLGLDRVFDYYFGRLEHVVIPNLKRLLETCRETKSQVIYTRVASSKPDGGDFCLRYKAFDLKSPEGSKEAEILQEIAPQPRDIVLSKTTQNVFLSTNLDHMLRNMGIESLIITGVLTNNCVEAAARSAIDYSYNVCVAEDCCAAFSQETHEASLKNIHLNFGIVKTMDEVISELLLRMS